MRMTRLIPSPILPADDLGNARDALTTARHDVRRVLDESRPELEGLAAEGDALRAALRQHRPPAPARRRRAQTHFGAARSRRPRRSTVGDSGRFRVHVDRRGRFARPDLDARAPPDARVHGRQPRSIGAVALMGTGWWLFRSRPTREHRRPSHPANRHPDRRRRQSRTARERRTLPLPLFVRRTTFHDLHCRSSSRPADPRGSASRPMVASQRNAFSGQAKRNRSAPRAMPASARVMPAPSPCPSTAGSRSRSVVKARPSRANSPWRLHPHRGPHCGPHLWHGQRPARQSPSRNPHRNGRPRHRPRLSQIQALCRPRLRLRRRRV